MAHELTFPILLTPSPVGLPGFPLAALADIAIPAACFASFDSTRAILDERVCSCHSDDGTFSTSPSFHRALFLPIIDDGWMMCRRSKVAERVGRARIRAREAR